MGLHPCSWVSLCECLFLWVPVDNLCVIMMIWWAAVLNGRLDIVRMLLDAGASVDIRSLAGDTPLSIAKQNAAEFPDLYKKLKKYQEQDGGRAGKIPV